MARSSFSIAYLSFYILLRTCQGLVGHLKQDIDFCHCMSHIFPHVTRVHFDNMFNNTIAPKGHQSLLPAKASRSTYAVFDYALLMVNLIPEPSRDRVSLLRL